jgi:hypothetical protein
MRLFAEDQERRGLEAFLGDDRSRPPIPCPRCEATLARGQDWCLECGHAVVAGDLRASSDEREIRLGDLGGLVFEMYRLGSTRQDLVLEKLDALLRLNDEPTHPVTESSGPAEKEDLDDLGR